MTAKKALDKYEIPFWLDFGTLLGVVRDGKLISHDTDNDIGVWMGEDRNKIKLALEEAGFSKSRSIEIENGTYGLIETYILSKIKLDLFYYTRKEDLMYCHLVDTDNGILYIREVYVPCQGFEKLLFNSVEFTIPSAPKKRLEFTYGKNWTIPIKNWSTPKDALNSIIVNKHLDYINH